MKCRRRERQINGDEKASEGVEKLQHKEGGGAVHLSRIDFNMSFKGHACWYIRLFFHKLCAFQKLKNPGITCVWKGNMWSYKKLIFFCVYRQGEQSHYWLWQMLTVTIASIVRRQWHPTPVLLPGKSHGQRGLVGWRPWGR